MIKLLKVFSVLFFLICIKTFAQKSQGIGTNTPNPRAVLDISVESPATYPQGLLLPRLTTAERTALGAVAGLATGMSIYDTTDKNFYTWDGTVWKSTGSIVNTIVGINGMLVNNSGGNFSISGQWISSASDKIYSNSFVGLGGLNTGTSILEVFGQVTANAGYRTGVGLVNGGNQAGFDFVGTNEVSLRTGGQPRFQINNLGIASFMGSNFIMDGGLQIRNLSTTGSVLTVDGLGNVGMGTISASQWTTTTSGIFYNAGNVGVGNNNPLFPLHVGLTPSPSAILARIEGVISARINSDIASQEVLNLANINGLASAVVAVNFNSLNAGSSLVTGSKIISFLSDKTVTQEKGEFSIQTRNNGTLEEKIRVNSTGLGINTSAPTTMLDVNGGARIRALSVTGSVLTVDGLGNVGMGTIAASTNNFTLVGNNIRTLNNTDNIQLASTAGAYLIQGKNAIRMNNNNSVFIGQLSGNSTTTGSNNNFIGNDVGNSNTTGSTNNFIGNRSGRNNTTGNENNFIGFEAGRENINGYGNNFVGYIAGAANISGNQNNFIGLYSGQNNISGYDNNFLGSYAGRSNTSGYENISIGFEAGKDNTVGHNNIFFGTSAAFGNITGIDNISIGQYSRFTSSNASNSIAIGSFTTITGSNQVVIGNNITSLGINTSSPTAMLDVNGGARIRALSVTGSVLTVDGLGNVGMGVIGSASQWLTSGSDIYYNSGKVAIGTTTPGFTTFQVSGDEANPAAIGLLNVSTNVGVQGAIVNMRSNSTSKYSLGAVQNGQSLGSFAFTGYDGTSFAANGPTAEIRSMATQNYTPANQGTNLIFATTPNNTNSSLDRMVIDQNGFIGIGTLSPTSPLHVLAPFNTSIIGMFVGNTSAGSPVNIRVKNNGGGGSALALEYGAGNLFAMTSNTLNEFAFYSSVANKEFVNYAPTTERLQISNSSGSVVINASATGIGVQTFTGNEALRVGGFNPSSPKGLVFPYVTTAQMVVLTAQLGALDAGMAFFNPQTKNVEIWDGTQWQGKGDNGGGGPDQYNWNVGGNTVTGFPFVTMTGYGKIGTNENFPVAITTGNQPRIFVSTTGGVGIGAILPTRALLEQSGNVNNTFAIFGGDSDGMSLASRNDNTGIFFNGYIAVGPTVRSLSAGFVGAIEMNTTSGVISILSSPTSATGPNIGSGLISKMNILTNGNIGINVNTPTSRLQVNGDVGLGDGLATGNKPVVVWLTNTGTPAVAGDIVVVGANDDSFSTTLVASSNSAIGVLTEGCASNAVCKVAVAGVVSVNITTPIIRGQHCISSATSGSATSTPTPNPGASIGVFLQSVAAGTQARVLLR